MFSSAVAADDGHDEVEIARQQQWWCPRHRLKHFSGNNRHSSPYGAAASLSSQGMAPPLGPLLLPA